MLGRVVADRYRLSQVLGEGGFGRVYLAADLKLSGKAVVVKFLRPELVTSRDFEVLEARFRREMETLARLPAGIGVGISDFDRTEEGAPFLVMDFLDGRTLADEIRERGRFQPEDATVVALGVSRGLDQVHRLGIVHRDIKPSNVMLLDLGGRQWVALIDFGIAAFLEGLKEGDRLTGSREMIGTLLYASPEQYLDRKRVDHRTDLYALGAIIYEMLAGFAPFTDIVRQEKFENVGIYFLSLLRAKKEQDPTPIRYVVPTVPEHLGHLVMSLLARDPAARPQSAREVVQCLEQRISRASLPQPPPRDGTETMLRDSHETGPSPRPRPRGAWWLLAGVVAVLAGLAIFLGLRDTSISQMDDAGLASLKEASRDPGAAPEVVPPHAASKPADVRLSVRTNPSGASVHRDGVRVGVTPLEISVPADKVPIVLVLAHDGFLERSVEVIPDRDRILDIELQRAVPRAKPAKRQNPPVKRPPNEPPPHERFEFK